MRSDCSRRTSRGASMPGSPSPPSARAARTPPPTLRSARSRRATSARSARAHGGTHGGGRSASAGWLPRPLPTSRSASGSTACARRSEVRPPPQRLEAIPLAPSVRTRHGAQTSRGHGGGRGYATRLLIAVDGTSVWIAVLRAQLLLSATRVSAGDAPPILEERKAREGQARGGIGEAEGEAERETRGTASADREGRETGTGRKETGGEARGAGRAAETGRGRGVRQRGARRARRPRSHRRTDEGRVREARGRLPGRRGGVRRGVPERAVQGRDPHPRGLARLPPSGGVRARCGPEGS